VTFNVGRVLNPSKSVTDMTAVHYERSAGERTVTYTLRTKKDAVAVREVADHIAALNAIDEDLAWQFKAPRAAIFPWMLGLAMVFLLVTGATLMAVRSRRNAVSITIVELDSASDEKEIQGHAQHRYGQVVQ
jgi:hypothetical protein